LEVHMPIQVTCACGKQYNLKEEFAGRRAKCPGCGAVIDVPRQQVGQTSEALSQIPALAERDQWRATIAYRCPGCGADLENPTSLAGQQDTCPDCGLRHMVPKGHAWSLRRWILVPAVGFAAAASVAALLVWPQDKKPDAAASPTLAVVAANAPAALAPATEKAPIAEKAQVEKVPVAEKAQVEKAPGANSAENQDAGKRADTAGDSKLSDLAAGGGWIHPVTKKTMILVPTRVVRPTPKILSGTIKITQLSNEHKVRQIGLIRPYISIFELRIYFVTGFLMDRDPITNEEYLRFCKATQTPLPPSWKGVEPKPEDLQKPVSVPYESASKYAEWAALRLPLLCEYDSAIADEKGVYPWTVEIIGGDSKSTKKVADRSPLGINSLAQGAEWVGGSYPAEEGRPLFEFKYADDGMINILQMDEDSLADGAGFRCVSSLVAVACMLKGKSVGGVEEVAVPEDVARSAVKVKNNSATPIELMLSTGQRLSLAVGQATELKVPVGLHVLTIAHQGVSQSRFWFAFLGTQAFSADGVSAEWTITDDFGFPISIGRQSR
jgi:DNA-directed RNA polymerase subunit RPC12/RpoP